MHVLFMWFVLYSFCTRGMGTDTDFFLLSLSTRNASVPNNSSGSRKVHFASVLGSHGQRTKTSEIMEVCGL